jgi:hypothetical protein
MLLAIAKAGRFRAREKGRTHSERPNQGNQECAHFVAILKSVSGAIRANHSFGNNFPSNTVFQLRITKRMAAGEKHNERIPHITLCRKQWYTTTR